MRMLTFVLAIWLSSNCFAERKPTATPLRKIIAQPERFDKSMVKVSGFLVFEVQSRHAPLVLLFPSETDAKQHRNAVLVEANQEILDSRSRLGERCLTLVAIVHAVPTASGAYVPVLKATTRFALQNGTPPGQCGDED